MDPRRIADLLDPFLRSDDSPNALTSFQLNQILTYINMLLRWNARMNLTAVREPEEIVTRHFGESFFAARQLFPLGADTPASKNSQVFDLGSGAGFPGIPIKIWAPQIHLTLIESNGKKATFLREVVRGLQLANVSVEARRAEDLKQSQADILTLRAVEKFEAIVPVAAELLKQGGRLVLLVGTEQTRRVPTLASAVAWQNAIPVPFSSRRVLLAGSKVEF